MAITKDLPRLSDRGGFDAENALYRVDEDEDDDLHRIGSVEELLEAISSLHGGREREIWYRGHRRWSWKLTPTFHRDYVASRVEQDGARRLESLIQTVRDVLEAQGQTSVRSSDALLIAQHYGLATPLLDWSTSPLVATWFALHKVGLLDRQDPPTLWMLDPRCANDHVPYLLGDPLKDLPGIDFAVMEEVLVRDGETWADNIIKRDFPIAVHSTNDFTTRIGRQSGKFTFSGPSPQFSHAMSGTVTGNEGQRIFAPLLLDANRASTLLDELRLLGVHEETVYGARSLDNEIRAQLKDAGLQADGRPV